MPKKKWNALKKNMLDIQKNENVTKHYLFWLKLVYSESTGTSKQNDIFFLLLTYLSSWDIYFLLSMQEKNG